jgi:hypothetical protein
VIQKNQQNSHRSNAIQLGYVFPKRRQDSTVRPNDALPGTIVCNTLSALSKRISILQAIQAFAESIRL